MCALYLYKLIRFWQEDCVAEFLFSANRLFAASAFFLRTEGRKLDATFLPGFFARLSLRPAYKLKQTTSPATKIDVIAGGEFSWFSQETVRIHCVENQLPLEMLLARQNEWNRFVMSIDQKQKCVVTDWFTVEIKNVDRIAA